MGGGREGHGMHAFDCVGACAPVFMCMCGWVGALYIFVGGWVYICIYIYTHICLCVCVCVCVYLVPWLQSQVCL